MFTSAKTGKASGPPASISLDETLIAGRDKGKQRRYEGVAYASAHHWSQRLLLREGDQTGIMFPHTLMNTRSEGGQCITNGFIFCMQGVEPVSGDNIPRHTLATLG